MNTHEEDEYTHLILGAPTVDITNLDTTNLTHNENTEIYKQKVYISCQNTMTVATNALANHPKLKEVIILEHIPRFDVTEADPTGLKAKLATFANSSLAQMMLSSSMKKKIMMGNHSLDCNEDQIDARYRDQWSGRYDGVHLLSGHGKDLYTDSLIRILKTALSNPSSPSSANTSSFHDSCPQQQYQQRQQARRSQGHKTENIYTVPVSNKFNILGN